MRRFLYFLVSVAMIKDSEGQYDWEPFITTCVNGSELSFFDEEQTYDAAVKFCKLHDSHLVKVHSEAITKAIEETLGSGHWNGENTYYIGARDDNKDNKGYKWIDQSDVPLDSASGYQNWRSERPNKPSEDCIALGVHGYSNWNDVLCTDLHGYICQKQSKITITENNEVKICQSSNSKNVTWKRNSNNVSTDENNKGGIFQKIFDKQSTLFLTSKNITEEGTYTCEFIDSPSNNQNEKPVCNSVQVAVNGTPIIQEVKNNSCNSSLFITWKPKKAAVGFPHRISVLDITNFTVFDKAMNESSITTELDRLNVSTTYHIEITACFAESCNTSFKTETQGTIDGVTDRVNSLLLKESNATCLASWQQPKHDVTIKAKLRCAFHKVRDAGKKRNITTDETSINGSTSILLSTVPNRNCTVSVQAKGCGKISETVCAESPCITPAKAPEYLKPPVIVKASNKTLAIKLSTPKEDNGLISCVFLMICYQKCTHNSFTMEDLMEANEAKIGGRNTTVAVAMPMSKLHMNKSHIWDLTNMNMTECDVHDDGMTVSRELSEIFYGRNATNNTFRNIWLFFVTTTPSKSRILFKTSKMYHHNPKDVGKKSGLKWEDIVIFGYGGLAMVFVTAMSIWAIIITNAEEKAMALKISEYNAENQTDSNTRVSEAEPQDPQHDDGQSVGGYEEIEVGKKEPTAYVNVSNPTANQHDGTYINYENLDAIPTYEEPIRRENGLNSYENFNRTSTMYDDDTSLNDYENFQFAPVYEQPIRRSEEPALYANCST